jgi:hypothetical protein
MPIKLLVSSSEITFLLPFYITFKLFFFFFLKKKKRNNIQSQEPSKIEPTLTNLRQVTKQTVTCSTRTIIRVEIFHRNQRSTLNINKCNEII